MILFEIVYIVFCIALASVNAIYIKDGKRIYHGINGALHLIAAAGCGYLFGWWTSAVILCNTRAVFDTLLNLFRGLPFDYVPSKPKSVIDKIEKCIFGNNGILPKVIYTTISITLNIVYYVTN